MTTLDQKDLHEIVFILKTFENFAWFWLEQFALLRLDDNLNWIIEASIVVTIVKIFLEEVSDFCF